MNKNDLLVRESVLAPTPSGIPSRNLAGSESCERCVRDRIIVRASCTPVVLTTGFAYDPIHSITRARGEGLAAV